MAANVDPIYLGHQNVEQDQVRLPGFGNGQCLFAVTCCENLVAMHSEAGLEDVEVDGLIVYDENAWRCSHVFLFVRDRAFAYDKYSRTLMIS
jgi:hypothetical protein